jgi:hypothetical protein
MESVSNDEGPTEEAEAVIPMESVSIDESPTEEAEAVIPMERVNNDEGPTEKAEAVIPMESVSNDEVPTEEAEAVTPMESVSSGGPNMLSLSGTGTTGLRRKAALRSQLPQQNEDISARKKEHLEEPFSASPDEIAVLVPGRTKDRTYIALNTDSALRGAPEVFASYEGAPCPICYEDLGRLVPKGIDFRDPFKTSIENNESMNSNIRLRKASCNAHSMKVHRKFPIWNSFRRQDSEKGSDRVKNMSITTAGLLHNAMKGAFDGMPFKEFVRRTRRLRQNQSECSVLLDYHMPHAMYHIILAITFEERRA